MTEQSLPPDALRPLVTFIFLSTFFGSVLVVLILTLIFFSTPQLRRHPVFILNVVACCTGICEAAISVTLLVEPIIYPSKRVPKSFYVASMCLDLFSGIFVDSILLFRILAFYPFSVTPTPKFVAIFTVPVLAKCGRFGLSMAYIQQYLHTSTSDIQKAAQSIWSRNPLVLAFTTLQVIDNSYTSGILLYKINKFRRQRNEFFKLSSSNLVSCLRYLFIIALGNFVFPVAINLASISMLIANASYNKAAIVFLFDNYMSIVGVVFATIWTRRRYWNRRDAISDEFQLETYRHTAPFTFDHTRNVLRPTIHFESGSEHVESVHESVNISVQGKGKEQSSIDNLNSSHLSLTKT